MFECKKCHKRFRDTQALRRHLERRYPCDQGKFECKECGLLFQSSQSRSGHYKTCKGRPKTKEDLEKEVEDLQKEVEDLKKMLLMGGGQMTNDTINRNTIINRHDAHSDDEDAPSDDEDAPFADEDAPSDAAKPPFVAEDAHSDDEDAPFAEEDAPFDSAKPRFVAEDASSYPEETPFVAEDAPSDAEALDRLFETGCRLTAVTEYIKRAAKYIYLLRPREFIALQLQIYKIGETCQLPNKRFAGYPKNSELIVLHQSEDAQTDERHLMVLFKSNFKQRTDIGTEYFEGDVRTMKNCIDKYFVALFDGNARGQLTCNM